MPELVLPWADRVSSVDVETDSHFPEIVEGVNVVLNRRRLSRWLSVFGQDADVNDFLLLDAIISSLNIPVSSTGTFGPSSSLGLRPFRLWEYSWIYKCLALAKGGLSVLDIGGPGSHLSLLTALAGNRVQSIDLNPAFVDAANRVARTFSLTRYNAFIGDGRDLSGFEAESFDAVICCSVLEHLTSDNQRIVLQQIARVLRPGGLAGLTFDYGPGAPGANLHLPPPHEPPGSACEAVARYEVGGLQIVGNRNLEEPLPGSLFRSPTIQYTIASLFVSRPPVAEIKLPVPENSSASVLKQVRISNLIVRSFDASVARYEAETAPILADNTSGATADTEPPPKPESQPMAQLQNELKYAEERAATAENLVELQRGQIEDLQTTTRIQKEEIERQYCQSQDYTVELSRYADRVAELEVLYAEASRVRDEEIERRRSETEAHMVADTISDARNLVGRAHSPAAVAPKSVPRILWC
jgi:SAM-dependent methyltransferase